MDPEEPPRWAKGLTQIEQMLVSPILPIMSVYTVKGGSQRFKGNCINFPQNMQTIASELPRLLKDLDILIMHAPGNRPNCRTFEVRRQTVAEFCRNAKQHNLPGWEDVVISEENLNALPEHGIPADLPTLIETSLSKNAVDPGPMQSLSGRS